jgi:Tol biopolymer transport system component
VFQSDRGGDLGLYQQRADGSGSAERLTTAEPQSVHTPETWSPDGKALVFLLRKGNAASLWTLPSTGDRTPRLFGQPGAARQGCSAFSPDGRWLAYASDEVAAGTYRVYVQPVPPSGAKYQVSADASTCPAWAPDGKELIYTRYATRFLFAADIHTAPGFSLGQPTVIRADAMEQSTSVLRRQFDVMPDGKQFLVVLPSNSNVSAGAGRYTDQINVVLNWTEELKRLVPTN